MLANLALSFFDGEAVNIGTCPYIPEASSFGGKVDFRPE